MQNTAVQNKSQEVLVDKKDKRYMHMAIAAAICILWIILVPVKEPLTRAGSMTLGIFLATVYLWTTLEISWVSVLCISLIAATGIAPINEIFGHSWGHGMVPFLIFCLILNYAMSETGLSRRMALFFITRKFVQGKPWLMLSAYFLSMMLIGLVVTPSPVVAMFSEISQQMFKNTGYKKGEALPEMVMATCAWILLSASAVTPMAHVVVLMILGFIVSSFGVTVSFLQYMMFGFVFGFVFFVGYMLVCRFIIRPDVSNFANLDIEYLKSTVPPMGKRERFVLIGLVALVCIWIVPDFLKMIPFTASLGTYISSLGSYWPGLLVVAIMSAIKVEGRMLIDMPAAAQKINWAPVIMMATLMLFGFVFNTPTGGITQWMSLHLGNLFAVIPVPPLAFVGIIVALDLVVTNFMSNTVAAILYTVFIPIAVTIPGVNALALGLCIAASCNLGFATPAANPPCGFIASTGWVRPSYMITRGWLFVALAWIAIIIVIYPMASMMWPM